MTTINLGWCALSNSVMTLVGGTPHGPPGGAKIWSCAHLGKCGIIRTGLKSSFQKTKLQVSTTNMAASRADFLILPKKGPTPKRPSITMQVVSLDRYWSPLPDKLSFNCLWRHMTSPEPKTYVLSRSAILEIVSASEWIDLPNVFDAHLQTWPEVMQKTGSLYLVSFLRG